MSLPQANHNHNLEIDVDGITVYRYPVRTNLFKKGDDVVKEVSEPVKKILAEVPQQHKIIVVGEKAVAVTQGRGIPIKDIKPSGLAKFLTKYVTKTKHGIGLGIPETMQLAIEQVGVPRILLAFAAAAVTKPFGIKGMFYRVAGDQARSVDGPTPYTIPPYNTYAVMGPKDPAKVAQQIRDSLDGLPVAIIDANDIGQNVLGSAGVADVEFVKKSFKDNPLGQTNEQTPVAIVAW